MPRISLRLYCFHVSGVIQRFINGFLNRKKKAIRVISGLTPRASAFMALAFCKAASASILAQLPKCLISRAWASFLLASHMIFASTWIWLKSVHLLRTDPIPHIWGMVLNPRPWLICFHKVSRKISCCSLEIAFSLTGSLLET